MLRRHAFPLAAVVLAAGAVASLVTGDFSRGAHAVQVVASLAICGAVALAWRAPAVAAAVAGAALVGQAAVVVPPEVFPVGIALLVLCFSLGARASPRELLLGLLVLVPGLALEDLRRPGYGDGAMIADAVFLGVGVAAGRLVRARTLRGLRYAGEATEARAALSVERARIARELHDIVAHSVSVMVVQATAAGPRSVDAESRETFGAIEATGRQALLELRRLLGVLRAEDGEQPVLAPQPGLDELAALVDQVRAVGQPVELRVEGQRRPLAPGLELSAYRVVQEGLTNAVKHAAGARTTVSVTYGERDLRVEVADNGGRPADAHGAGRGLAGLRERVALYDGAFEAAPADGGFRVRATLPAR